MASPEQLRDPKQILATILGDRPDLTPAAAAIFDYAQYLLDDDERLTKTGALDGAGRELLRARALETLGGPAPRTDGDDDSGDEDDSDSPGDDDDDNADKPADEDDA